MAFQNRGGGGFRGRDNYGRRDYRDRDSDRQMYDAVCAKCGADCRVPFRPSPDKEVFCSKCFEEKTGISRDFRENRDGGDQRRDRGFFGAGRPQRSQSFDGADLREINMKLDRILKLLTPPAPEKTKTEQIVEEIEFNSGVKVKPAGKKAKKATKKKATAKKQE